MVPRFRWSEGTRCRSQGGEMAIRELPSLRIAGIGIDGWHRDVRRPRQGVGVRCRGGDGTNIEIAIGFFEVTGGRRGLQRSE